MKGMQLIIEGNWGHFKRPETNNNPLTYDFITKPALIGLIGAVIGKNRNEMLPLFKQLSEDLLYGVQILNPIKKVSVGFTLRKAVDQRKHAPKAMEFIKSPKFLVAVALYDSKSNEIFTEFVSYVKNKQARFTPVLGIHNCPANLEFVSEGEFSEKTKNKEKIKCVISSTYSLSLKETEVFCIRPAKVPTFQNGDFWNLPDKYVDVIYSSENKEITVEGEFYKYNDREAWWLI